MAFTYDAGLRIRPPDPMPDCVAGESAQDYFSRVLAQCSLESATSAENASGDSAPTPFNVGELQSGLAQAEEDIEQINTGNTAQQVILDTLVAKYASGVGIYSTGDTSTPISFPSEGNWRVVVEPLGQPMADKFVDNITLTTALVNFAAAGSDGSFNWLASKE